MITISKEEADEIVLEIDKYFKIIKMSPQNMIYCMRDKSYMNKISDAFIHEPKLKKYRNHYVEISSKKYEKIEKYWEMETEEVYNGIGIHEDPKLDRIEDGKFNMWRGYPILNKMKRKGFVPTDQQRKEALDAWNSTLIAICGGKDNLDADDLEGLTIWLHWVLQNPTKMPELALTIKGGKGTGKSTLAKWLESFFGEHSIISSSPEQVAGRFNYQLHNKLFLVSEEATYGYSHSIDGTLKNLISNKVNLYEPKGKTAFMSNNHLAILILSNSDNPVMATPDERRYYVIDTGYRFNKDQTDWEEIYRHLNNEESLYCVLDYIVNNEQLKANLKHIHPRTLYKTSKALKEQIAMSIEPVYQFLIYFDREDLPDDLAMDIMTSSFYKLYLQYCKDMNKRSVELSTFGKRIKQAGIHSKRKNSGNYLMVEDILNKSKILQHLNLTEDLFFDKSED